MSVKERLNNDLLEDEYEEDEDTQEDKFLTFVLNREEYGIEIRHVTEIIGIQNITEVPDMPHYIKGVINLRGKVIPVMDVRLRFGVAERDYDDRTCIIVINIEEQSVGMIVDRVSEVLDIPKSEVAPPPKVKKGESSRFIKGMGKVGERVKILLNEYQLLFDFNKGED
ncbi:MAG: Chemotaxis protein CheW [Firmicutes bacterium ADurb.Bin373]|nr:MAG: Chemotaxis protein CheW [Firmicutes bacterium ADurb.Bin373]